MKVNGTNIQTLNNSGLSKEVNVEHAGVKLDLTSTKRGIYIWIHPNKIIRQDKGILIIPDNGEVYSEEEIVK